VTRWAVILAGGVGSRFWPLSTADRPKQLLPLATAKPLLLDTVDRLRLIADPAHMLVLTNAGLVDAIANLIPDLPAENIIAEPRPAGTAAALAWAAITIERRDGPDATMLCVHSDWAIGDPDKFRATLVAAEKLAVEKKSLVTVGVVPTRADTGFGYIEPAGDSRGRGAYVKRFVEKPDAALAAKMKADGYLWNSGIFAWKVGDFLGEVTRHAQEIAGPVGAARTDRSDAATFFAAVKSVSVDVGVLERSDKVMVLGGDFGWDDIGTWSALARVREQDGGGNVVNGAAHLLEATGNVVHAEEGSVVLYGVSDLVVVARNGMTLVTTREKAADLKTLVDSLPDSMR